jgi:hypothetical protein
MAGDELVRRGAVAALAQLLASMNSCCASAAAGGLRRGSKNGVVQSSAWASPLFTCARKISWVLATIAERASN